MMPRSGQITLLQMDGEITREELTRGLGMAKIACKQIYEIQKKALKEKYNNGGNHDE